MSAGALFDLSSPRRSRVSSESLEEQLVSAGLPRPRREHLFARAYGRNWAFDFAWPPQMFAVEKEGALFGGRIVRVDGGPCPTCQAAGVQTDIVGAIEYRRIRGEKTEVPIKPRTILRLGGGHNTGERLVRDLEKYGFAAILGWAVLRVTPDQIRNGDALALILRAFIHRGFDVGSQLEKAEARKHERLVGAAPW